MPELRFLVLASLASGRQHGYGVLADIRKISGGAVTPPVATLYRTLDRLTADGLVSEDGNAVIGGRFRRYYRLTDAGAALLDEQVMLRQATLKVARQRLKARAGVARVEPRLAQ
jgi:PadR family transcriptional regulator